jgi:hypothetical protein
VVAHPDDGTPSGSDTGVLRLIPVGPLALREARQRACSTIVVEPRRRDDMEVRWVLLHANDGDLSREAAHVCQREEATGVALLGGPSTPREVLGMARELGTFVIGAAKGTDLITALDLGWRAPLLELGLIGFYGMDLEALCANGSAAIAATSPIELDREIELPPETAQFIAQAPIIGLLFGLHGGPPDLRLRAVGPRPASRRDRAVVHWNLPWADDAGPHHLPAPLIRHAPREPR